MIKPNEIVSVRKQFQSGVDIKNAELYKNKDRHESEILVTDTGLAV